MTHIEDCERLADTYDEDEPAKEPTMTEPKEALKPCPFCGEHLYKMSEGMGYFHSKKNCTLSDFQMLADGYSEERWNTRAEAAENAVLREKLAEIRDVADIGSDAHKLAIAALTGADND